MTRNGGMRKVAEFKNVGIAPAFRPQYEDFCARYGLNLDKLWQDFSDSNYVVSSIVTYKGYDAGQEATCFSENTMNLSSVLIMFKKYLRTKALEANKNTAEAEFINSWQPLPYHRYKQT